MYTVKLYNNTGYNVENIPDSATLLGTPSIEKTAVDTVQNYVMTSVRISAVFDDVKNADYCQIGNFYYFIGGIAMTSRDVAVLTLIPDYITSYGVSNLNFLDGITIRHHVDDDRFGLYTEDDPLLYCNEPLELEVGDEMFTEYDDALSFVVSSVDLVKSGLGQGFVASEYTDPSGDKVTVPHLPQLDEWGTSPIPKTTFSIYSTGVAPSFSIPSAVVYPLFDTNNISNPEETVLKGIQYCRDIAAESAILGCYQIPSNFVSFGVSSYGGFISSLTGTTPVESTGIFFANPSQMPRNLRVLYGDYNRFGIMTMAGNRMEAKPEEIYYSGAINNTAPRVIAVADPRMDGKPYFRFEYINKETPLVNGSVQLEKFWRNVIAGESWYQIPLVFTTPSGIIQQQKYYDTSHELQMRNRQDQLIGRGAYWLTQAGNAGMNALMPLGVAVNETKIPNSDITTSAWSRTGDTAGSRGALNTFNNWAQRRVAERTEDRQFWYDRKRANLDLSLQKSVVVPDVMFPYTNGTIRDFVGNGVIPYKYRPSDKDMVLQDKLLTMYGYAVTDKLVNSYFFNRQYFNYVQASNVSIGNQIPQWWKAGIVAQLAAGVRVWHVTPDETHYDNNPIVTNP